MNEQRHLRLAWGGASDQGRVRSTNQDAMYADRGLFVVADGMGGHQGGEVAANLAVRTVSSHPHNDASSLLEAVITANRVVHDASITRPDLHGMGTTLTAISVIGDESHPHFGLVNVGDSRIYRQRNGTLTQLTLDHSYVAELMRRGEITIEEAAQHPYRNMLTRAVGVHETIEVDEWQLDPDADDRYVLCSDGLTNEVSNEEISAVLNQNPEAGAAARGLVRLANLNGGRDNITVLVVDVFIDTAPISDAGDAELGAAPASPVHAELTADESDEAGEPPDTDIPDTNFPDTGSGLSAPQPLGDEVLYPDDAPTEEVPTVPEQRPTPPSRRRTRRRARPEKRSPLEWLAQPVVTGIKPVLISLALVVMVIVMLLGSAWYARSGYFVSSLGDEVVIYKGRMGGLLWFDPTLEERPGILLSELSPTDLQVVTDGYQTESIDGARSFTADLETRTDDGSAPGTGDGGDEG